MAGSASRGWHRVAPKTKSARQAVADRCGVAAFLGKGLTFPVVAKNGKGCRPDCRGLDAAYSRAKQRRHRKVAKRALRLAKKNHCPWVHHA